MTFNLKIDNIDEFLLLRNSLSSKTATDADVDMMLRLIGFNKWFRQLEAELRPYNKSKTYQEQFTSGFASKVVSAMEGFAVIILSTYQMYHDALQYEFTDAIESTLRLYKVEIEKVINTIYDGYDITGMIKLVKGAGYVIE